MATYFLASTFPGEEVDATFLLSNLIFTSAAVVPGYHISRLTGNWLYRLCSPGAVRNTEEFSTLKPNSHINRIHGFHGNGLFVLLGRRKRALVLAVLALPKSDLGPSPLLFSAA